MADAACREHPEVNFFPERGESTEPARAVCDGCLVRPECFVYARENGEFGSKSYGVWAGLSAVQRRRARAARAA
jgi:WhiB family redox-sensing transcriptional regulator